MMMCKFVTKAHERQQRDKRTNFSNMHLFSVRSGLRHKKYSWRPCLIHGRDETGWMMQTWLLFSKHFQCSSNCCKQFSRIFVILHRHKYLLTGHVGIFCNTYKSVEHLVTRRPSFKQCAGSRFSCLQSMKSSNLPHIAAMIFISPRAKWTIRTRRTIIIFAISPKEECGAFQRCACCPELLYLWY
jgi:hypothetical protein